MPIQPFPPPFPKRMTDDLRERLSRTRWIDEIAGPGWQDGLSLDFLQDVCRYWRDRSRLARPRVEWKNKHATKVPVGETVIEKPSELVA